MFSADRGEGEEEEWFCVKVYKVLTMEFRNKKDYIYVGKEEPLHGRETIASSRWRASREAIRRSWTRGRERNTSTC